MNITLKSRFISTSAPDKNEVKAEEIKLLNPLHRFHRKTHLPFGFIPSRFVFAGFDDDDDDYDDDDDIVNDYRRRRDDEDGNDGDERRSSVAATNQTNKSCRLHDFGSNELNPNDTSLLN